MKIVQIKNFLNSVLLFLKSFFRKFKKQIIQCIIVIFCIVMVQQIFTALTTKVFYYLNKDDNSKIIKENRKIISIKSETDLQAFIRVYLDGSLNYVGALPFSDETKLISISHDSDKKYLVLNWNGYFLRNLNDDAFEKNITVLLRTIAENFHVEKVYFLIEGKKINIPWKKYQLESGIILKDINF